MAERDPSALPDPALFEVAGRVVTTSDVLRAAEIRGALGPSWRAFLAGVAAQESALHRGLELDPAEVERRSDDLRYERSLLTAVETEDWLDARGLTLHDLDAYVRRDLWRARGPVSSPGTDFATSAPELRERFRAEVTFSAELDRLAHGLARRMAFLEGSPSGSRATTEAVAEARRGFLEAHGLGEADLGGWVAATGTTREALERTLAMEVAFEARGEALLTARAREGVLDAMRIPLTRAEVETLDVDSLDAAREVGCCVRDDGAAMAGLAAEHGLRHARRSLVLEDLDAGLRNSLLSAAPGGLLEPIEISDGFQACRLLSKREPDTSDAEILRRVDREILEAHDAGLEARCVRWLLRVDDPA